MKFITGMHAAMNCAPACSSSYALIKSKKGGLSPGEATFKSHVDDHPKDNQFHVCVFGDTNCFSVYTEVIHCTTLQLLKHKENSS